MKHLNLCVLIILLYSCSSFRYPFMSKNKSSNKGKVVKINDSYRIVNDSLFEKGLNKGELDFKLDFIEITDSLKITIRDLDNLPIEQASFYLVSDFNNTNLKVNRFIGYSSKDGTIVFSRKGITDTKLLIYYPSYSVQVFKVK